MSALGVSVLRAGPAAEPLSDSLLDLLFRRGRIPPPEILPHHRFGDVVEVEGRLHALQDIGILFPRPIFLLCCHRLTLPRGGILPAVTSSPLASSPDELRRLLGSIDIYLLDQWMRGRIPPGSRILDAGCGPGRNLAPFLRMGYSVRGVDADPRAIAAVRRMAHEMGAEAADDDFRCEPIESMSFENASADVVVSSAVLHFAADDEHFEAMLRASWRVLRSGGLFFCRLASTIGMARERFTPLGNGRYRLPDGSERYLVDEEALSTWTDALGGRLLDPVKTTVVQDLRCMTTWVLRKG